MSYLSPVLFYTSLVLCISLGSNYRSISDVKMKRHYGTGLGLMLSFLICGYYVFHSLLMVWGNIIIMKCCDRRYMHHLSLLYTWMYLLYLHLNFNNVYIIWLHQVQALRLVGLAFEMVGKSPKVHLSENEVDPSAAEIISYSFFFVGLHKGPYYRWKIFEDHFNEPFSVLGDCWVVTEMKLKRAIICCLGYLLLRSKVSPELYRDAVFYSKHGADFRFLYNVPLIIMYLLHYEMVSLLSTSVCTETGFGVYPANYHSIPGHGPTRYNVPTMATTSDDMGEFNFTALKCFHNRKLLFGPRMIDSIKSWNMPTRFWFWSNIYKGLFTAEKEIRSAITFVAWIVWSGPSVSKVIVSVTLWVYVQLEKKYTDLYNTCGPMKLPWDLGFSIMRLFCFLYLTPCLVTADTATIFKYYNSIYWIYHFTLFGLMVAALLVQKLRSW